MNISPHEFESHPLMKQIQADVQAQRDQAQAEHLSAQMAAAQLREEQGKYLKEQYHSYVDKYEELRRELHKVAGQVFEANQHYSRLTGRDIPDFALQIFGQLDLPTLRPKPGHWTSPMSTTRAAMTQYFANGGRWE